jgi:predicted ATP-grasp superfamily ATP-dependent carboligase
MLGMCERIAIVGASARALAESAVRAGFRVAACDLFGDQDLRAVAERVKVCPAEQYPGKLPDLLAELHVDAWCYTGGLENHPDLIARMREKSPLWGNPEGVVRRVRDPRNFAEALEKQGFLFPRIVSGIEASTAWIAESGEWIVKMGTGAGGGHVRRWRGEAVAPGDWLQEYVEGTPCSAVYAAGADGVEFLGATRQILARDVDPLAEREFRYLGSTGPLWLEESAEARLVRLGEALVGAFGLLGVFGVDYVLARGEIRPIEVNPRYPASAEVIERATGRNVFATHCAAFRRPNSSDRGGKSVGGRGNAGVGRFITKFIVFAPHAGRLRDLTPLLRRDAADGDLAYADVPTEGELHLPGEPVLTVLVAHTDQDRGVDLAREAADRLFDEWFEQE